MQSDHKIQLHPLWYVDSEQRHGQTDRAGHLFGQAQPHVAGRRTLLFEDRMVVVVAVERFGQFVGVSADDRRSEIRGGGLYGRRIFGQRLDQFDLFGQERRSFVLGAEIDPRLLCFAQDRADACMRVLDERTCICLLYTSPSPRDS